MRSIPENLDLIIQVVRIYDFTNNVYNTEKENEIIIRSFDHNLDEKFPLKSNANIELHSQYGTAISEVESNNLDNNNIESNYLSYNNNNGDNKNSLYLSCFGDINTIPVSKVLNDKNHWSIKLYIQRLIKQTAKDRRNFMQNN
ncbi:uncharacterized protein ASCRUDRAFT_9389 [Ascoidea rubescens DSM 1968]|uniref:Uncharacterized protein n=1 Tax=Ascoidea rubescens DSM 1968 TaxID=1344418 RepID=A0A1D2VDG8_9ASCO|nr:hypothetical protein ASCRUDRAFT_9389 [Ascoidea rubescens DSM 1968]ODV59744.1 hypothetical protein ASCRUDRAFT_9389 [Ascoidea rubescens DSM 1968]